jgi:acylglycerol lipase
MRHEQNHYLGRKNTRIHFQSWMPKQAARASVVIAHGLGEHSGRYAHVARRLVAGGCAVYALDHRGHGQSEGPRALIETFDHAVDDIDQLVDRAHRQRPGRPLFLLGHSMGGALSLSHALRHADKLAGLMLSGPAVALDGAPPLLKPISKWLSAVAPRLGLFSIDPRRVTRDRYAMADYSADPLNCHGKVPVATLAALVRFVEWLPTVLPMLKLPLLLMHGAQDQLAGVAGSRRVFEQVSSKDKTLKVYEGLQHEVFNELPADRERVLDDMATWLHPRLAA